MLRSGACVGLRSCGLHAGSQAGSTAARCGSLSASTPVKARARRVASHWRLGPRPGQPPRPWSSMGRRVPSPSPRPVLPSRRLRCPLCSRGTVAAPTAPPINSARPVPTVFWGDRTKSLSTPTLQAGPSSLLERAQEISRLPGLGGFPIKLIQSVLPMIEEHIDENPLPPELPHTTSIPEQHEPFPPARQLESGPMAGAWDWPNTSDLDFLLEVTAPLMEPPVEQPLTSLTIEESEGPMPIEDSRITDVVDEESGEQEPSAALGYLLDLEYSAAVKAARSETRISPPTHEEIERSLCPLPNGTGKSTEFECGADIIEAEMGKVGQFVASLQDDDWEGSTFPAEIAEVDKTLSTSAISTGRGRSS
ncbi:hypothetical protein BJV74DRAFT_888450 [Russula compacta]|nr:hypothetical protein BJV74DRAFT_888450 [Russula compacta]